MFIFRLIGWIVMGIIFAALIEVVYTTASEEPQKMELGQNFSSIQEQASELVDKFEKSKLNREIKEVFAGNTESPVVGNLEEAVSSTPEDVVSGSSEEAQSYSSKDHKPPVAAENDSLEQESNLSGAENSKPNPAKTVAAGQSEQEATFDTAGMEEVSAIEEPELVEFKEHTVFGPFVTMERAVGLSDYVRQKAGLDCYVLSGDDGYQVAIRYIDDLAPYLETIREATGMDVHP